MDVSVIKGSTTQQPQNMQTSTTRDELTAAVNKKTEVDNEEVEVAAVESTDEQKVMSEEERYAQVQQAAKQYVSNHYVVSDTRFTIYKDANGQLITRFTSLKDGSVTYIPEPDLYKMNNTSAARRESLVEIKA